MEKKYLRIVDTVIASILLAIIGVRVSFNIDSIRYGIKKVLLIFIGSQIFENLKKFYSNYLDKQLLSMFWVTIFLALIYKLIYHMVISYKDRKLKRTLKRSKDEFTRFLYNYLESNEKRCYVITGEWGVGKTHSLKTFLHDYLKYSTREKVYNISCFGISTRDELINEIKLTYEREDSRYFVKLNNFLKAIPILGEGIYNLVRPRYELKDMQKKAIFVFDDFERITQSTLLEEHHRFRNNLVSFNRVKEFTDINKRLDGIVEELSALRRREINSTTQLLLQRYNIVAGLINELIEVYDIKVIVVCNIDKIDSKIYFDIFNEKLSAIRFNIESKNDYINRLIIDKVDSIKSMHKDKKSLILKFFNTNKNNISDLWKATGVSNLRILSGIISAFIDIIDRVELNDILNLEKNIFYSIFAGHIAYYSNTIEKLKDIEIGKNLIINFKKYERTFAEDYGPQNNDFKYLENKGISNDVRWVGNNISFTWIIGNIVDISKIKEDLRILKERDYTIENFLSKENINKDYLIKNLLEAKQIDLENFLYAFYLLHENNISLECKEVLNVLNNIEIDFSIITKVKYNSEDQMHSEVLHLFERYKFEEYILNSEKIRQVIFTDLKDALKNCDVQKNDGRSRILMGDRTSGTDLLGMFKKWSEKHKEVIEIT